MKALSIPDELDVSETAQHHYQKSFINSLLCLRLIFKKKKKKQKHKKNLLFHEIFHCVIAIAANFNETRGRQWISECLRCQRFATLDYAILERSHRLKINPKLQGKCKCQDHGQRPNMQTKGLFVRGPGFMSVFQIIHWSSTVQEKKKEKEKKKGKLLQRERT